MGISRFKALAGHRRRAGKNLDARPKLGFCARMNASPRITISYCVQCNWLLRAGWMAQELLSTFGEDIGEVVLRPASGGLFQIAYDGEVIWDRKAQGFPEAKELKQTVRDRLAPGRDLGHIDRPAAREPTAGT